MAFDFSTVVAPFRMQPGLRRLAPGETQLTPNRPGDIALAEKLAILREHPTEALVAVEGFDAEPALAALVAHGTAEHPAALATSPGSLDAPLLGWTVRDDGVFGSGPSEIGACLKGLPAAWRRAGLLSLAFAEDFAILEGESGRIPWLAVCLPSNWAPEEKVGRLFAEVHAPVADNAMLLTAASHLTRLVTGEERWERFVWTLADDARLSRHPRRSRPSRWCLHADAQSIGEMAYLRTERQTFIPLAALRQAVFTIHVEVRPLVDAAKEPDDAFRLFEALASMSPAVLAYRGLEAVRDRLLAWLASRARLDAGPGDRA